MLFKDVRTFKSGLSFVEIIVCLMIIAIAVAFVLNKITYNDPAKVQQAKVQLLKNLSEEYINAVKKKMSDKDFFDRTVEGEIPPVKLVPHFTHYDEFIISTKIIDVDSDIIEGKPRATVKNLEIQYKDKNAETLAETSIILYRP